ncbi:MAG TPA: methyltransferase [Hyphomicrobiaceae bacterium]|nr:methyltransferase [Hyphomicrobiaceae bacterium]
MGTALFITGALVGAALIALLLATLARPALRIWPPPGPGTAQSYVFWILFRSLNILCFAVAVMNREAYLGLPLWLRVVAFAVLVVSVATFIYAFKMLGRDNSYGASEGLVTGGIYQWTRNPQNAMLIVVYGALAIAADNGPTYVLCLAMMLVYTLMVLLEEPWLEFHYGDAYRRYCESVPRFFNWRRAFGRS